jgi:hypothetical protein
MNAPRIRLPGVLAMIVALALALPGAALASHSQTMTLQDDQQLIYASPSNVATTLSTLRAMGVDRVRVSVVWSLLAPKPSANKKPKFDATNPNAYPGGAWARYDVLDTLAHQDGLQVYFQPTAPAPNWATTPRQLPQGYRYAHNPNAKDFGQFVQAVGRRYDGHVTTTDVTGQPTTLPAVQYWGIWNEPNIGGWMTPQWNTLKGGKKVEASPAIYRRMVDAAWTGLTRTGHRHDTIMIGETAAYGAGHKGYGASMDPLVFLRALYCVGTGYKPLKGTAATEIGCPGSGSASAFARAHPALFDAAGWAHHPYDFVNPPNFVRKDPNSASLSSLSRVERALDRSQRAYGHRGAMPIDITEWGVQSRGPSPYVAFSQAQQAEFLNEGEYMAWANPRVPTFAQFLLVDAGPNTKDKKGSRPYWATFQSGLLFFGSGAAKPAYNAFELPLWLPNARHSGHTLVWGQIRPTDAARVAQLQFRPPGSSDWTTIATIRPTDPEGFFTTRVSLPTAGSLRLDWTAPNGQPFLSRIATVS